MRWEPEQDARLRELKEKHRLNWPKIAQRMGLSVDSVKHRYALITGRHQVGGRIIAEGQVAPAYDGPTPRTNDHMLHLRLLLDAIRREQLS